MARRHIDFISVYCDSWCERCAFTERCSAFSVKSALPMCDDNLEAAIELAIGSPRAPGHPPQKSIFERLADVLGDDEPTDKEIEEIGRELDARRKRIERQPLAEVSLDYAVACTRWLRDQGDDEPPTDPAVRDAIETIGWDCHLIHVKIMRALDGRDEYPSGDPFAKSAVQSDWNGSAKVSLLSIERSERAWRLLASAGVDAPAAVLADVLARLRAEMAKEFPNAMAFRRPGFDDKR